VIHTAGLTDLSADLPMVIEVVEDDEHVGKLLAILDEMMGKGFVTVEKVRVVRYAGRGESARRVGRRVGLGVGPGPAPAPAPAPPPAPAPAPAPAQLASRALRFTPAFLSTALWVLRYRRFSRWFLEMMRSRLQ